MILLDAVGVHRDTQSGPVRNGDRAVLEHERICEDAFQHRRIREIPAFLRSGAYAREHTPSVTDATDGAADRT